MKKVLGLMAAFLLSAASVPVRAQTTTEVEKNTQAMGRVPIYRMTVVARTIQAINYLHRKETLVDFHGTALEPAAVGGADVYSAPGVTKIAADFKHLQPTSTLGAEFTTYVLWAISIMNAREATQTAEDARMTTVRKLEAEEEAAAKQPTARSLAWLKGHPKGCSYFIRSRAFR